MKKPVKMIQDVMMNYTLMNCQSLKMKMKSMATNFNENKNSFLIANETWFKERDPQLKKMLDDFDDEHDIKSIIKDRKVGKRGLAHGGVAIFYDATKCSL